MGSSGGVCAVGCSRHSISGGFWCTPTAWQLHCCIAAWPTAIAHMEGESSRAAEIPQTLGKALSLMLYIKINVSPPVSAAIPVPEAGHVLHHRHAELCTRAIPCTRHCAASRCRAWCCLWPVGVSVSKKANISFNGSSGFSGSRHNQVQLIRNVFAKEADSDLQIWTPFCTGTCTQGSPLFDKCNQLGPGHSTPAACITASLLREDLHVDQSSYGFRWFISSLVQVPVGCCVLASCSVTLAGAPVTLLCCLVLYG